MYWLCQILGWGAYCLLGVFAVAAQIGWRGSLIVGYALFFLYSIGLTHLLRREIHQRQWLTLPLVRAVPLLLLAAVGTGLLQAVLVATISLLTAPAAKRYWSPLELLWMWTSITGATLGWTTIYTAIHTLRQYNESRYETLRLELALREAELRALEAQVNPHFLFNCLNSLRGMIVEDSNRARDMVTQLSNILRYNLQRDRQRTVLLREELAIVRDYLALETVRYEERLRVRFDIDEAAELVSVPPMLLQILVENALKHGIAQRPQGGELIVRAKVDGTRLELDVENSGRLTNAPAAGSTQVGLRNARERLQILYGKQATLDLQTRGPDRVAATVLLPRFA